MLLITVQCAEVVISIGASKRITKENIREMSKIVIPPQKTSEHFSDPYVRSQFFDRRFTLKLLFELL